MTNGNDHIRENVPLAPLTTFKIGGPARFFAEAVTEADLGEAFAFAKDNALPVMVMGGGSNMLVSDAGFPGLVIHPAGRGISSVAGDGGTVSIEVAAAEPWDDLVSWAAERGYWGIENLSHIPGSCGAFAVQNVGAYGAEASQVVEEVNAYDTVSGSMVTLLNAECGFGYRQSIFNSRQKGRYVILSMRLRLSTQPNPNLSYADLEKAFTGRALESIALGEIRDAVIRIREAKFPYPTEAKNGSAGSFFKAVAVEADQYQALEDVVSREGRDGYLERLRHFALRRDREGRVKVPSAFLIDVFGLMETRQGGAFLNPTQPVVILNNGTATANDVLGLFRAVRLAIHGHCGLVVENEPELIGFTAEELEEVFSL